MMTPGRIIGSTFLAYAMLSAVLVTGLLVHALVEAMTGYALSRRAHAIYRVVVNGPEAPSTTGAGRVRDAGDPEVAEVRGDPEPLPENVQRVALDLRRELSQTASTLDTWEGRLRDILKEDLDRSQDKLREEHARIGRLKARWDRFGTALARLVNEILSRKGLAKITREELEDMVLGGEDGSESHGERRLDELLAAMNADTLDFDARSRQLHALRPEVIAGILATGGGGGLPAIAQSSQAPSRTISDEQAVRFLLTLEQKKLTQVLTALQDESPERAATLTAYLLSGNSSSKS